MSGMFWNWMLFRGLLLFLVVVVGCAVRLICCIAIYCWFCGCLSWFALSWFCVCFMFEHFVALVFCVFWGPSHRVDNQTLGFPKQREVWTSYLPQACVSLKWLLNDTFTWNHIHPVSLLLMMLLLLVVVLGGGVGGPSVECFVAKCEQMIKTMIKRSIYPYLYIYTHLNRSWAIYICVYIYRERFAVKLVSGPSLAILRVTSWAKWGLLSGAKSCLAFL